MTSTSLFMASLETTSQEVAAATNKAGLNFNGSSKESKPESSSAPTSSTKTRGRKPSNKAAPNGKKQPQRGLGVEKLEKLRIQERWKKIAEMPRLHPLNFPADHFYFPALAEGAADPLEGVPVQYGAGGYGGTAHHHRLTAAAGVHQQRMGQYHGGVNGGFGIGPHYHGHGVNGVGSSSAGHHVVMMQDQVNKMVHPQQYSHNGLRVENTRELSSTPKTHNHDSFDIYTFKKKGFNGEINRSMREKCTPETLQMGGLMNYFVGLNSSENVISDSVGELTLGFGTTPQATHIAQNIQEEGVEVVAVHRTGNPSVGGQVFIEYEFLPGKNDTNTILSTTSTGTSSGTGSKMMEMLPTEFLSSLGGKEASYNTTSATSFTYGADTSNSPVDLSLKL